MRPFQILSTRVRAPADRAARFMQAVATQSGRVGDKADMVGTVQRVIFKASEEDASPGGLQWSAGKKSFGVCLIRVRDAEVCIAGNGAAEFAPGAVVGVTGKWTKHPRFGLQVRVDNISAVGSAPSDSTSGTAIDSDVMERFLSSSGIKGVGPATAKSLVASLGPRKVLDTLLSDDWSVFLSVKGVGPQSLARMRASWTSGASDSGRLALELHSLGLSLDVASRAAQKHGAAVAADVLRGDPYDGVGRISGMTLKAADDILRSSRAQTIDTLATARIQAACRQALRFCVSDGHTGLTGPMLLGSVLASLLGSPPRRQTAEKDLCGFPEWVEAVDGWSLCQLVLRTHKMTAASSEVAAVADSVAAMIERGEISWQGPATGSDWWFLRGKAFSLGAALTEDRLALCIGILRSRLWFEANAAWSIPSAVKAHFRQLSAEQLSAVESAMQSPLSVVTGGPGTGKTYTIRAIVRCWLEQGMRVALACPTARAAFRLNETLAEEKVRWERLQREHGDHSVPFPVATTVHRLLEYGKRGVDLRGMGSGAQFLGQHDRSSAPPAGVGLGAARLELGGEEDRGGVLLFGEPTSHPVDAGALSLSVDYTKPSAYQREALVQGSEFEWDLLAEPDQPLSKRGFLRDARNPLKVDAVLIDEASMVDSRLAQALFSAIPAPRVDLRRAPRLVLVGDSDQLPSVGPGSVLSDVVESSVASVTKLGQVFRQAAESPIVRNAHSINRGRIPGDFLQWPPDSAMDNVKGLLPHRGQADHPGSCVWVPTADGTAASHTVATQVLQLVQQLGYDPQNDLQVLAPLRRGPLGTGALNSALRGVLNPAPVGYGPGSFSFRPGDKVVQRINDYEKGVINGDMGVVQTVERRTSAVGKRVRETHVVSVNFEVTGTDSKLAIEYSGAEASRALELAYAMTVHKAQGSEWPVVVLGLLPSHYVMLNRGLLYTAVSRATRLLIVVGTKQAAAIAVSRNNDVRRCTGLAERIRSVSQQVDQVLESRGVEFALPEEAAVVPNPLRHPVSRPMTVDEAVWSQLGVADILSDRARLPTPPRTLEGHQLRELWSVLGIDQVLANEDAWGRR
jgi:ATP-dependent exoDNAse (exonuclease V) alpha subunit